MWRGIQHRRQWGGEAGGLAPKKLLPVGAVARVFPNASIAMYPLKLSLPPYMLNSGAGTEGIGCGEGLGPLPGKLNF